MKSKKYTTALSGLSIDLLNKKEGAVTFDRLSILVSMNLSLFLKHIDYIFITQDDHEFLSILSCISLASQEKPIKAIIIDFESATAIHLSLNSRIIKAHIKRQIDRHTNYHSTSLSDQLCTDINELSVNYISSNINANNPFCLLLLAQSLVSECNTDSNFSVMQQDLLTNSSEDAHFQAIQRYMRASIAVANIEELMYSVEAKKFIERYNKENERTEGNQNICETSI